MIGRLSPSAEAFLSDIKRLDEQATKAQRQISSGVRIERPSDGPDQVSELLQLRARVCQAVQVQKNLVKVKAQVDAGEKGLESAVNILDRAVQIATQGASTATTDEQRQILATEAAGILERLQAITGTTAGGAGVFGGVPQEVTDVDGLRFQTSRTVADIFDGTLAALDALKTALLSGGIGAVLPGLKDAQKELSNHLTFYGTVQSRIKEAQDTAAKRETADEAALATIRETDVVAAATEMTEARTHLDAAMSARAALPRNSLFDYLG